MVEFQMACALCTQICYETHGDHDRVTVQQGVPSFFKVVSDQNLRSGSLFLRIPPMFMEDYGYNIKDKVTLKGPTGYVCELRLGYNRGLGFRTGFGEFLDYHSIEKGDHILFTLIANSQFAVKVYSKSGCEKAIPPVTNNHRGRVHVDAEPSKGAVIPPSHTNDWSGKSANMKKNAPRIDAGPSNKAFIPSPHIHHHSGRYLKNIASCLKMLRKRDNAARLGQKLKLRREGGASKQKANEHMMKLAVFEDEGMTKAGHGNMGRKRDDEMKRGFSMLEQCLLPLPISKIARKDLGSQQAGEEKHSLSKGDDKSDHDSVEMLDGEGLRNVLAQVQPHTKPQALDGHIEQDSLTPNQFASPERGLSPECKRQSAEKEDLIDIGADFQSSRGLRKTTSASFEPQVQGSHEGASSEQQFSLERSLGERLDNKLKQPEDESKVPGVLPLASRTDISQKIPAAVKKSNLEAAHAHTISNPSVSVVITKTYSSKGFLHFPTAFAKKWFPQVTADLLLVDIAGGHWPVKWYPKHVHKRFSAGWRQFSQAHKLKEGDVCVFELKNPKEITFLVHIFRVADSTCNANGGHSHDEQAAIGRVTLEGQSSGNCENDTVQPTNVLHEKHSILLEKSLNIDKGTVPSTSKKDASISPEHTAGEVSKSGRSCKSRKDVGRSTSSPTKAVTAAQYYAGREGMVVNALAGEEVSREESKGDSVGERGPALVPQQETTANDRKRRYHKISQGCRSTNSMRQKALDAANALQTSNPHIPLVMRPSNVGAAFSVFLPGTFVMPEKSMKATLLDSSGKSWSTRWLVTTAGRRLSAGWRRFAEDHFLQAGDVCVFEMIDFGNLIISIHIFRVWEEGIRDGKGTVSEYGRSTKRRGKVPQRLAFKSQRRPVTEAERMSAEQAARALEVHNPSFTVILRNSAVYRHFLVSIPRKFANQWLPCKLVRVSLTDTITGQSWTATWAGNCKRAPTLRSWKKFARFHYLEEGDVCVFELTDPEKLAFLVHIFPVVDSNPPLGDHWQRIVSGELLYGAQHRDEAREGQAQKFRMGAGAHLSRKYQGAHGRSIFMPARNKSNIMTKTIYTALRQTASNVQRPTPRVKECSSA